MKSRGRVVVLVPAAALVGVLIFAVVSSPLLGGGDCSDPTYAPDGRSWEELPAAALEQSSDNCVGFCFNAVVESESEENSRIARVRVVGEDGALTRGVVDRSRVLTNSHVAVQDGEPVRFACYDRVEGPRGATRFDDCVQMLAHKDEDPACATASEAISDASQQRKIDFDMFLFGL